MKFFLCRSNKCVVTKRAGGPRSPVAESAKPDAAFLVQPFGSPSPAALAVADVDDASPSSSEASAIEAFRPSPVRVAASPRREAAAIVSNSPGSVLPFEEPADSPSPVRPIATAEQQRDAASAAALLLRTNNSFNSKLKLAMAPSQAELPLPSTSSLPPLKPLKLGLSGAAQQPRPALAPLLGNAPPPIATHDDWSGRREPKSAAAAAPEQPGAPKSSKRRSKKQVQWGEADVAATKMLSPIERRTGVEASFLAVRAQLDAGSFSDEDDDNGFGDMPRASVVLRAARQAIEDDLVVDDAVVPFTISPVK